MRIIKVLPGQARVLLTMRDCDLLAEVCGEWEEIRIERESDIVQWKRWARRSVRWGWRRGCKWTGRREDAHYEYLTDMLYL